ncbi:MAG TPA: tRNA adenosine(34) deaminase TadA [Marinagarivorans sp.]
MSAAIDDVYFMHLALLQAERAFSCDEVPVGAVIEQQGRVIGRGFNRPIQACDPTAHAEVQALRAAANATANYRLPEATLYVTVEPCTMCLGALIHARIKRIVFAAYEPKAGRLCSHSLLDDPCFNHRIAVTGGVCELPACELMQRFFAERRARKKALKQAASHQ